MTLKKVCGKKIKNVNARTWNKHYNTEQNSNSNTFSFSK